MELEQKIEIVPKAKDNAIWFKLAGKAQHESSIFYEVLILIKGKSYKKMHGPFKLEIKIDQGVTFNFVPKI